MARRRRQARPMWVTVPIWAVVAALVGWGLWQAAELFWQAAEFRRSVMAEVRPEAVAPLGSGAQPDDGAPGAGTERSVAAGDSGDATPGPATIDEWAAVMKAGELLQDVPAREPGVGDAGREAAASEPATSPGGDLAARGRRLLSDGEIVEGRAALNAALNSLGDEPAAEELRQELTALNAGVFLGSAILAEDPAARYVEVQPGDSFLKLARTYEIPAVLLEQLNPGLRPQSLKPATGVKIVQGPFHARVFKSAGRLDLFAREMYVRSFPAAVEEGTYLPVGTYRLRPAGKIQAGSRTWIGFEGISDGARQVASGWIYGQSGPRMSKGEDRISGVKLADADLLQLYNVLVETHSLVRVDP